MSVFTHPGLGDNAYAKCFEVEGSLFGEHVQAAFGALVGNGAAKLGFSTQVDGSESGR